VPGYDIRHGPLHGVAAEVRGEIDHGRDVVRVLSRQHVVQLRPGAIDSAPVEIPQALRHLIEGLGIGSGMGGRVRLPGPCPQAHRDVVDAQADQPIDAVVVDE
jgi:hypothetical protein